eukprot:PhF_6_TR19940/c0_g1_i2/m.29015/K01426/E3.5.1.4, amiE; amidase
MGHAPHPDDNKYNAWAWRTDIVVPATPGSTTKRPLEGIKIALKDNVCVQGVPMCDGSRILQNYVSRSDATIVTRMLEAGAHITGKAHCEDLCLSGGSFSCAYGPVRNPYDILRQSGGSSSGSAVLVAVGAVDVAIACDQGGSIRIPSCWCGVVGLKPTWSLVPYTGIASMEPTLDHAGPVARTVKEAAALLEVIAGYDLMDSRCSPQTPPQGQSYVRHLSGDLTGLRVGIMKEGFGLGDARVDAAVIEAAQSLTKKGAVVVDVSVPMHLQANHIWTAIGFDGLYSTTFTTGGQPIGVKAFLADDLCAAAHDGILSRPNELSKSSKAWLIYGEYIRQQYGASFYAKGRNLATTLTAAYTEAMQTHNCDVLVMPTLPILPTLIPEQDRDCDFPTYFKSAFEMIANTAPFNVTGHPALTVPVKLIDGLPVGMQIVGRHNNDVTVLKVGDAFESIRGDFPKPGPI